MPAVRSQNIYRDRPVDLHRRPTAGAAFNAQALYPGGPPVWDEQTVSAGLGDVWRKVWEARIPGVQSAMVTARDRAEVSTTLNSAAVGLMDAGLDWYVGQTAPQQEWRAHGILGDLDIPAFLPTQSRWISPSRHRKTKTRRQYAIMPRMLFVGFSRGHERWLDLLNRTPVMSVIGVAGVPTALPGHVVQGFVDRIGAEVDRPDWQRHMPRGREYKVGDRVRIIDGALKGHVVTVAEIRGPKSWVLSQQMLLAHALEIPTRYLEIDRDDTTDNRPPIRRDADGRTGRRPPNNRKSQEGQT